MIPTLSFLVLSLIFHTKALDGGTRGALRQQILAGAEIYLTPAAPESERTIDANWIKEALKKHVRIRIHNAIIQGRLDLRNTVIDQEIDLGGCTVKDYADFSYTTFKREFFASDADFVSPASFQNTTFERKATFQHIRFEGNNINFSDAHFLEEFDATQAQFGSMGDASHTPSVN